MVWLPVFFPSATIFIFVVPTGFVIPGAWLCRTALFHGERESARARERERERERERDGGREGVNIVLR
jgi:hypothetical protein